MGAVEYLDGAGNGGCRGGNQPQCLQGQYSQSFSESTSTNWSATVFWNCGLTLGIKRPVDFLVLLNMVDKTRGSFKQRSWAVDRR